MRLRAALILALALAAGRAGAQTPGTGAIAGTVFDPGHSVLVGATVTAIEDATQAARTARTDARGDFRIPLLPPGEYTVAIAADGFQPWSMRSVLVTASAVRTLDATLTIADAKTVVSVSADQQIAETQSSALGGLVDETTIQALPLANRNYTQILGLLPGVVVDLPNAAELGAGTQNVASEGATPTANNIQFNGIDANNLVENSAATAGTSEVGTAIPAVDTIQEFRVQTANFDAAYGRGSGANVDVVSRSGSNVFHGSAWEFVRNNKFNANDFFSKLAGQPRPDLKQNQFGALVGGPIRRDRLFFLGAYQGLSEVNGFGDEQTAILPMLTADRSAQTLGAQFCPAGHLDSAGQPAAGYFTAAGGPLDKQVACDGSNINPVALAILNAKLPNGQFAVPSPQVALPVSGADATDQVPMGQSTFAIPARYREDQFTVNVDQVLTPNNALAGRFFYSRAPTTQAFSPNAANVPGWGTNALSRNTMFVLSDTQVFNSALVNVARFGYMRFDGVSHVENPLGASALGEGVPTGAPGAGSNAPGLILGGFSIGDAGTPYQWQVTNNFVWQDTLAWIHGRHSMRYGLELKRAEVGEEQPFSIDGLLIIATFDDFLLGQSAAQNGSPFGLSNVTISNWGGGLFRRNERYTDVAGFAQDDIRLTPRLMVNAGLRYEIFGAPIETNGRLANFNLSTAQQGALPTDGTFSGFTLPANFAGSVPAGVTKTSFPGFYRTPMGDVAPRLGFAWQLTERPMIVLRGGYGIYYDRHSGNLAEQTMDQLPFASQQFIAGAANGAATLESPFVPTVPPPSQFPQFAPRTPTSTPFIEATNPKMRDGMTQEYNLNLQYGLSENWLLQAAYVGSQSQHRSGQWEFDQALLASPASPVNGETSNSIDNVTRRLPYQGISSNSLYTDSLFVGNYNALQLSLRRRLQHGLELQAGYTWAKNLDEVNGEFGTDVYELQLPTNDQHDVRRSSYGPAGDDRDQRFVGNFSWTAPQWRMGPTLARRVLSGWQFSGVGVIQSGIPLSVFDTNAGSVYGLIGGEVRAQRTGSPARTHGSLFSRVMNGYLDPAGFTRAPEAPFGTSLADQDFGNSGVGFLRGPGQHNVDLAVERSFPVAERGTLRLRTEFFNATNTPQFGNPSTSLGYGDPTQVNPVASSSFGRITSTVTAPRIVQFAVRYVF